MSIKKIYTTHLVKMYRIIDALLNGLNLDALYTMLISFQSCKYSYLHWNGRDTNRGFTDLGISWVN